ncbi:hypothetical protein D3C83_171140 [compost metagenome]
MPSTKTRNAITGAAAKVESTRSSTPPWPGMMRPESLRPKRRLTKDSNRSPPCAAALKTKANSIADKAEKP